MTELLPYYRLAARYEIPSLFVMNKCEEQAVVEDYRQQVASNLAPGAISRPASSVQVFAVPRDDSAYQPPAGGDLASLRDAIAKLSRDRSDLDSGVQFRAADLLGRLEDQVLEPFRIQRKEADRLVDAMRDM